MYVTFLALSQEEYSRQMHKLAMPKLSLVNTIAYTSKQLA